MLYPFLGLAGVILFMTHGLFWFQPQLSWRLMLDPVADLFIAAAFFFSWLGVRTGVYVGDAGVMARVAIRSTIVPWHEIAYAEVAEVPKWPVIWQRGPSRGLVLVAPSGQRRPLPARLAAPTYLRWGRGGPPYVVLSQENMNQLVACINELAPGRRQPWLPSGGSPFPPS